jgi:hypothetical protein
MASRSRPTARFSRIVDEAVKQRQGKRVRLANGAQVHGDSGDKRWAIRSKWSHGASAGPHLGQGGWDPLLPERAWRPTCLQIFAVSRGPRPGLRVAHLAARFACGRAYWPSHFEYGSAESDWIPGQVTEFAIFPRSAV